MQKRPVIRRLRACFPGVDHCGDPRASRTYENDTGAYVLNLGFPLLRLPHGTGVGGQRSGSDVHWGNHGFRIDLALHHPVRAEDRTIGVLCDATRFAKADDPIEWEAFRAAVLQGQGWQLHRLWTPQFFRDPSGSLVRIHDLADEMVSGEGDTKSVAVRRK